MLLYVFQTFSDILELAVEGRGSRDKNVSRFSLLLSISSVWFILTVQGFPLFIRDLEVTLTHVRFSIRDISICLLWAHFIIFFVSAFLFFIHVRQRSMYRPRTKNYLWMTIFTFYLAQNNRFPGFPLCFFLANAIGSSLWFLMLAILLVHCGTIRSSRI